MFERLQPRTRQQPPPPPQEEPLRYRDVLFIIFSIALTVFLLVCAFRGGHMIFDNLEDARYNSQRQQIAQDWVDHCRQLKDAEVFSACLKAYR